MTHPNLTVTTGSSGLRVNKMRKSYRKKVVIRDVSMELNRGEVVALLGPNGSGKTTSFYTIAGLVFPEAGSVTIDGQTMTDDTVTIRDRDTLEQERVPVGQLEDIIRKRVDMKQLLA